MQFKSYDFLAVSGAVGILAASFLAFASTKSGLGFVSLSHMPTLFYLLPVMGIAALGLAIATLARKVIAPPANLVLGIITLLLSGYTGVQASGQLEEFVYQQYAFQADRDKFEADFNARREDFNKSFESFSKESPNNVSDSQPTKQAEPVVEDEPIVIADVDKTTFGAGFYLAIVASFLLMGSSVLLQKEAKINQQS